MLELFYRPEVLTFLTAVAVAALGKLAGPAVGVPEEAVNKTIALFVAIFLGAVVEGKFKGLTYKVDLAGLLKSTKFRIGLGSVLAVVVNSLLTPLGYNLDDQVIADLLNFALAAVGGVAGLDAYRASSK